MRRFMIVVALAATLAFGANEVGKRFLKATGAGEPTITDTKTSKRSATTKRSRSKGSTAKAKGAQAKRSAGKSAKADAKVAKADGSAAKADAKVAKAVGNAVKADAPVTKADGNAAKADAAIAKAVGNAVKADAPVTKADGNAAKTDAAIAKAVGNAVKADAPVTKADGNAAKADAKAEQKTSEVASNDAEQKSEKKTSEVASRHTSSGTTPTYAPASDTSSKTITSPDGIDFSATAIGLKLQKDSKLRAKIEAKLQAAGYRGTVYEAAYGFQNVAQLNEATDMVQNHGHSFERLKVLMTGKYVDPETHIAYRAHQLEDGTVKLLSPELATNPVSR